MTYSFAKGLSKGFVHASIAGLGIVAAIVATNWPELYSTSVVDLLSQYLKQILGTMTVGGILTIAVNYLKVKYDN